MPLRTSALFSLSNRYLITIPAITVPLALILLNTNGYFIGQHLTPNNNIEADIRVLKIILIVAKLLELFMLASSWTLIVSLTRYKTLRKASLGERGSYSQIGGSRDISTPSPDMVQIAFTLFCTSLAGSASTILMSPKLNKHRDFTTVLALNGSADAQWPVKLTSQHLGGPQCDGASGLYRPECVSNGLISLGNDILSANRRSGGLEYAIMTPKLGFSREIGAIRQIGSNIDSWSFAPHAATALIGSYFWPEGYWNRSRPGGSLSVEVSSQAAAVGTLCNPYVQKFSNEAFRVSLPLLQEYDGRPPGNEQVYIDVNLSKPLWGSSSETLTNISSFTTVWVALPSQHEAGTAGLVILGPADISKGFDRAGVVCSIDARWIKALHTFTATEEGAGYVSLLEARNFSKYPLFESQRIIPPNENGFWRRITADYDWLQALTPIVPSLASRSNSLEQTTELGNLLLAAGFNLELPSFQMGVVPIKGIESILSTAIADAVSRIGLEHRDGFKEIQTSSSARCINYPWAAPCPEPVEDIHRTPLTFTGYLTGYAYNASQPSDYVSIAVLTIYVLVTLVGYSYSKSQIRAAAELSADVSLFAYSEHDRYDCTDSWSSCSRDDQPSLEPGQRYSEEAKGLRLVPIHKDEQQSLRKEKHERPPLRPGLERIEWTCECGERIYGDFEIDESVDALNASLSGSVSGDSDLLANSSNTAGPSLLSSDHGSSRNKAANTANSQRNKKRSKRIPRDQPKVSTEQLRDAGQEQHATRAYLNLCVNVGEFQKSLGEVELTNCSTDGEMFKKIRCEYLSIRGGLAKRILRRPTDIHFVRFSLEDRYKVGILNSPRSLPPNEELSAKRCHYRGPLMPPHIFMHYLNSSFPHKKAIWLHRLPRKLHSRITQSGDELPIGWGIHIIEGTNRPLLFWFSFVVVIFSLIVSSIWAGIRKDIQGAFGIGAWIVAIPGVTTMAMHFRWGHD